ncbi:hypothetical protein J4439_07185 [Candidatus Woesearchaeota archaeon]|nr:hypothetical protein [Candidatus Woesearchaeota archaeon]
MSGIILKDGEATLQVDTRFYGFLAAVTAASEFCEKFWVQLDGAPDGVVTVRLVPKSADIDLHGSAREFYNYMLALMDESLQLMTGKDLLGAPPARG